ncbi:MAG TPA: lipoyl(octanoyl) transferase LipB [Terriglobales bacterium]|nr:lipoyl(octanoyl) transferase LipB [Terriglobales bacterium]
MITVLHLGTIDYGTALNLQQSLVELRKQQRIPDVLLLLEHPPVITFGRNASQKNLLASNELLKRRGVELFESNRGGDVTFHGPGQLVGYPILDLRGFSPRLGAVEFVRRMEEALIRTCGDLSIPCGRICGLTGVWTQGTTSGQKEQIDSQTDPPWSEASANQDQKKIAAIGVHISRGITSHGFALNVTTNLDCFKLIVPCGISDRPVTSIAQELEGKRPIPTLEQVAYSVSLNFGRVFARQMLWLESLEALLHGGATNEEALAPETSPAAQGASR